ncbi:rho GTPase-activating protein conundrum [Condylostylus longicornis]|uniref:rho GTPase-activating protein conundrum n=1 Tax=Condylostylus longicornis TaxID=2530218 RepID=UPI00244DCDA7|nr:rho GTPase-activating protein conundrum [Condylostylus longicornis]
MDNISEPEFYEYLSEYRLQSNNEPISHYEEGELEAQWLVSAGFPELTKPFEHGLEIQNSDIEPLLHGLPKPHAEAVKQRVRALNRTVRGRTKSRYKRKPDIRDVFRDFDDSSTGTRSRSATPDSLDSIHGDGDNNHEHESWNNTAIPPFVSIFDPNSPSTPSSHIKSKQKLRRVPSAPLRGSSELFRGSHVRCDIPSFYTDDGIELLGFSRIGTIHIPRVRSGSDPECSVGHARGTLIKSAHSANNISIDHNSSSSDEYLGGSPPLESKLSNSATSSPHKILNVRKSLNSPSASAGNSPVRVKGISFENMCRETSQKNEKSEDIVDCPIIKEQSFDVDTINEQELKKLHKLFWLELATLFDKHQVTLDKRKPFKRRRKEEGNLFGVSLNALIRRDQQITGEDSTLVPLFLQGVLAELTKRGATEKGILRVAGHKQKTEILYTELESIFYQKPEKVHKLLSEASCHDLSALLKRWLRELPQPLLTCELIQLFYQCNAINLPDRYKALSLVCLLLPHENRNTLRSILKFLNYVIERQDANKMTKHNVATIIAPSLFPPRYIHPIDKNNIEEQVKVAAECCHMASILITQSDNLFMVPKKLIEQSKSTKVRQGKRAGHRKLKQTESLNGGNEVNPNHIQRIVL